MAIIEIKGAIIPNDDKWFYDWFEMDSTAPKDIVLPESGEDVEVFINSGGGDVYAGSEIYTKLRSYAGNVTVKIVGIAASAASVIAMAGNRIEISPTAQIMIHNVWSVAVGDHEDLRHEAGVLEGFNQSLATAYMAKTGKTQEELLALMREETWFTAERAVSEGFADEVMFARTDVPQLVASVSNLVPHQVIEKMQGFMASQSEKVNDSVMDEITSLKVAVASLTEEVSSLKKGLEESENQDSVTVEVQSVTPEQGFGRFCF